MPSSRTLPIAILALLVMGEVVARLQGDRLCSDHPGVVYERDPSLGWRHVPGLRGRIGTCDGPGVPHAYKRIDADGFVGPVRARDKPAGVVRVMLLGGNAPEGLGVHEYDTMARVLERSVDERRGARLEVLNAGTGGWAIDNDLVFFRKYGAARAPDVVLVFLDPMADLVSISPAHMAALGRRVPAKPYFSLVGDRVEQTPPFALAPAPPIVPNPGPLAASALYRLLGGVVPYTGAPMAWAASGTFPHGTIEEERARSADLARAILRTFRDEVAAAGGRLAVVVPPLPQAATKHTGRLERETFTEIVQGLEIPLLDLTGPSLQVELRGALHLSDSVRLQGAGHTFAGAVIWTFLQAERLLPPTVVPPLAVGGGRARPALGDVRRVLAEELSASRHSLLGSYVQFGLIAVCITWLAGVLPRAARDWVVVALGILMLRVLGRPEAALLGVGFGVVWYSAVEWFPRRLGRVVCVLLVAALVAVMAWNNPFPLAGMSWTTTPFLALVTNVAVLRLVGYAIDRTRGGIRVPLEQFLAALFFFPTLPFGPIAPIGVASPDPAIPSLPTVARACGRIARGWVVFALAPIFLALEIPEVFPLHGMTLSRPRLWLFVAESAALLTLLLAGWSDVAIGLARLVGVRTPENLRRPWLAASPAEFWRRWHVSLSCWWRDYVYVPLGGRGAARSVAVVFLLSAVWHGWTLSKMLGWRTYLPPAWGGLALCAALNAMAVMATRAGPAHGGAATAGPKYAMHVAVTATFVALTWLLLLVPSSTGVRDVALVYLRLIGLR